MTTTPINYRARANVTVMVNGEAYVDMLFYGVTVADLESPEGALLIRTAIDRRGFSIEPYSYIVKPPKMRANRGRIM